MYMENLPQKGPVSREFWPKNPPMGSTYPYPQHVMYPPGVFAEPREPSSALSWDYMNPGANAWNDISSKSLPLTN